MDVQLLEQLVALNRLQSLLMTTIGVTLILGIIVIGFELYGFSQSLRGIAVALQGLTQSVENVARMTAEVLRRTPER